MGVRASLERRRLAAGERLCASSAPARASQGAQAQKTVDQLEGRNSFFFLGGASESDRPRCFFFLPMPVTTATATTSTWV